MTSPPPTPTAPYPPVLAAKLRRMDPWLLANILNTKVEQK